MMSKDCNSEAHDLFAQVLECASLDRLGENVCELLLRVDIFNGNLATEDVLTEVMQSDSKVLGARTKLRFFLDVRIDEFLFRRKTKGKHLRHQIPA